MAVAEVLDPKPGERVLDIAAAPGGKSTHIAALMRGEGLLVVNDVKLHRARVLAKHIERWGARNVVITNETADNLANHLGAYFHRVLVDAPCSGEGMFRKNLGLRETWTPHLVRRFASQQEGILHESARLVIPGGYLVYATCTFAPQENEGVVARFLDAHPEFDVVETDRHPGFAPGRPDWVSEVGDTADLTHAIRIWPHHAPGEGHFMILLRKSSLSDPIRSKQTRSWDAWKPPRPAVETLKYYLEFWDECMALPHLKERLASMGSSLYAIPDGLPDLRGLSVIHWGWWLGTFRKRRFVPSHALAMGIESMGANELVTFPADGVETQRFLRGEVLESAGLDGWVLVCVDDFPLSWAKRVNGRLKSHMPSWLRIL